MKLSSKIKSQVKKTIKEIGLKKKHKIVVALSGGKDSTLVAYLLHELGYKIQGFHIDLKIGNYSNKCMEIVKKQCSELGIKLNIYDMKKEMGQGMCYLRSAVQASGKGKLKNCAVCGVIKKWIMNKISRKLKADYIATGHNLDDEAQTYLMNILKGSPRLSLNTGVVTKNISDKKFIPRIKPLFYVAEEDIREYSKEKKLPVVYEACPCALDSYRIQIREFLNKLTEAQKNNIIKNVQGIIKNLGKENKGEIKYCEICKEPTRNKVCKMCEMIKC